MNCLGCLYKSKASEGRAHYSSSIVGSNLTEENNKFNIAWQKVPFGKYLVNVIGITSFNN